MTLAPAFRCHNLKLEISDLVTRSSLIFNQMKQREQVSRDRASAECEYLILSDLCFLTCTCETKRKGTKITPKECRCKDNQDSSGRIWVRTVGQSFRTLDRDKRQLSCLEDQ